MLAFSRLGVNLSEHVDACHRLRWGLLLADAGRAGFDQPRRALGGGFSLCKTSTESVEKGRHCSGCSRV